MRNGRIKLLGVTALAATMATLGCSSSSSTGGAGGSPSAGTGGVANMGGSPSHGGTGGGASGSGGATSLGGSSGSGGSGGGASGSGGATSMGGSSGSGGSSGGGGVTSLSGTRAVNALTPTEAMQLCTDSYNYFGTAITNATTCKWKGVAFAASSSAPSQQVLQQNCTSQEMACLQVAKPWDTNAGCNDIPATCTATVAEYSACISDEAAAFTQTVNGLPACTMLASTDTAKVFDAQAAAPPASCAALSNKCPDLSPPAPLNQ